MAFDTTGGLVVSNTKNGSGIGDPSRVAHHSLKISWYD